MLSQQMERTDIIEPQIVTVKNVNLTDPFEGVLTFTTQSGSLISAFFWGDTFSNEECFEAEFSALNYPFEWEMIFSENKEQKTCLEKGPEQCSYYAYGIIKSLNPIIADFGDIKLELGEWTHDNRVIGEFIYWKIERLEIRRYLKSNRIA